MSPSLLVYHSRHESFRDSDLFAVVAVFEHLLKESEIDATLSGAVREWKQAVLESGPGTIIFDSLRSRPAGGRRHVKNTRRDLAPSLGPADLCRGRGAGW